MFAIISTRFLESMDNNGRIMKELKELQEARKTVSLTITATKCLEGKLAVAA